MCDLFDGRSESPLRRPFFFAIHLGNLPPMCERTLVVALFTISALVGVLTAG